MKTDNKFILRAVALAKENNSVYGVVIVKNGREISSGTNMTEEENDPTSHAEIVAIRNATKKLGSRYLKGCILYTTVEPCPMCTSAVIWAKMQGIVFGANLNDLIELQGKRQIGVKCKAIAEKGSPAIEVCEEICRKDCRELLKNEEVD